MVCVCQVTMCEFAVDKQAVTDSALAMWVSLVGLAGAGFKAEKEKERDRHLSAASSSSYGGKMELLKHYS